MKETTDEDTCLMETIDFPEGPFLAMSQTQKSYYIGSLRGPEKKSYMTADSVYLE